MASRSIFPPIRTRISICERCLNANILSKPVASAAIRSFTNASYLRRDIGYQLSPNLQPSRLVAKPLVPTLKLSRRSRPYSTATQSPDPTHTGIARLAHRRLISLSGPDAAKFLQGLITNNVDSTRLSPFYAAFLDARGRVQWDVFIWMWPELVAEKEHWACYIEVDADEVDTLKKHLKKHKLRSKVKIEDVATEGEQGISVWAAWGGAHEHVKEWSEIAGMQDPRAGEGLYRYLSSANRETIAEGMQPVDAKYYHFQRYIQGVAEGPKEIRTGNSLPMEYNVDLSGGIDFKKGCYVGQELTIRTKHTGVVRKRVLPIRLYTGPSNGVEHAAPDLNSSSSLPPNDSDIKALDDKGAFKRGRPTGRYITGIGNVGLALCRLDTMTSIPVEVEGATYTEGAEFGIDVDGEIVKVKPVIHPWFEQRKEVLWNKKKDDRRRVLEVEDD